MRLATNQFSVVRGRGWLRDEVPHRPAPTGESDWLTLGQAAKYLGVAQSTIRRWSDEGRVSAFYTPGGHRRYRQADLDSIPRTLGPRTKQKCRGRPSC